MGALKNRFSWSHSRAETFNTCLRRYYLNHYGFWGGWDRRAPKDVRELYIQKNMATIPMWVGSTVHDWAERAVKAIARGRPLKHGAAVDDAARQMREEWDDSQGEGYRHDPKRRLCLQGHYYGGAHPANLREAIGRVSDALDSLFKSAIYRKLARAPGQIMSVEELASFTVNDPDGKAEPVSVWVKLDALVKATDGPFVILDWKTGQAHKREGAAFQLGVYKLHAVQALGEWPADGLEAIDVALGTSPPTVVRQPVAPELLEGVAREIITSAEAMRALLDDVPENTANPERFPMTSDLERCRFCSFRRTCGRE